jgi:DNA-binding NtrC family response regulator
MSGKEDVIDLSCLSPAVAGSTAGQTKVVSSVATPEGEAKLKDVLDSVERDLIMTALKRCDGNKSEAARQLGISRSNLIAKAQSFGIE